MRVLITGVAGHLGSKLAEWIVVHKPGVQIVGIDNLSAGFRENVPPGVEFVAAGVTGEAAYRPSLYSQRFDAVFHFASFAAECLSPFVRLHTIRNVWEPTAALLNNLLAGPGCGRFVFASSVAVYGRGLRTPFDERDYCQPNDPYGVAKLACEHDVRIAGEQHGLDWCILRPHNIYGPGQSLWQSHRNVFGIWMRAALEGRPLQIFGDGRQKRAFSYIDDILPCLWEAAFAPEASRQTINLGGGIPKQIIGAAELSAELFGACAIEHLPPRHEIKEAWCTTAKSEALLGFQDRTTLRVGLERMWAWAQEAWERYPSRRRQEKIEIELRRGLPATWEAA